MDNLIETETNGCEVNLGEMVDVSDLATASVHESVENYISQGLDKLSGKNLPETINRT